MLTKYGIILPLTFCIYILYILGQDKRDDTEKTLEVCKGLMLRKWFMVCNHFRRVPMIGVYQSKSVIKLKRLFF